MPNLGTITVRSTHFYLVDCAGGKLMFDAGWVGEMPALLSRLRAYGVAPAEIKYVMFSHAHPDHADLVQEIKRGTGARLIVHEVQIPFLAPLAELHSRKGEPYVPITVEKTDFVLTGDKPHLPAPVGLDGWVVPVPGHSPDHIALVLADGKALIGDLPSPDLGGHPNGAAIRQSWRTLLALGGKRFYPAHTEPFEASHG